LALTVPTIQAIIKAKREAKLGTPDDQVLADLIYEADAEAIFDILTTLADVTIAMASNGLDSNGDTLVTNIGAGGLT